MENADAWRHATDGNVGGGYRMVQRASPAASRLQTLGLEVLGGSPEDATQWVKREAAMLAKLIQMGKIRPE
jgi:hypothetical protein